MKVIRNQTKLIKVSKEEDTYVNAPAAERISFIWELTAEIWSLKGSENVKQRLPRNVINLTRQ